LATSPPSAVSAARFRQMVALVIAVCLQVLAVTLFGALAAVPVPVPDWYVYGVTAALRDPTPGMLPKIILLPRVREALAAIETRGVVAAEQRKTVFDILVRLAASDDTDVQQSVAFALAALNPGDSEQLKTVIDILVRFVAIDYRFDDLDIHAVRNSAIDALGTLNPKDAAQRQAVFDTLLRVATAIGHPSAIAALAAFNPDNAEQRQAVLETLLRLSASDNPFAQNAVAVALDTISKRYTPQRKAVLDILARLPVGHAADAKKYAAAALGALNPDDAEQRQTVLDALVRLLADGDLGAGQQETVTALDTIGNRDPEQRKAVLDILVRLAASNNLPLQQSTATALGGITRGDAEQRKTVLQTLVRLAASDNTDVQQSAVRALGTIGNRDPEQRQTVLDILVRLAASNDTNLQQSTAAALDTLNPSDTTQRQTVFGILVRLAASDNTDVQQSAAAALVTLNPDDAAQRQTVLNILVRLSALDLSFRYRKSVDMLGTIGNRDAAQRQTVLDILVRFATSNNTKFQEIAAEALRALNPGDAEQRKTVFDTLVRLAASNNTDVQYKTLIALSTIGKSDLERRKAVLDILVRFAASDDTILQQITAAELGEFNKGDAEQRKIVLDTLVRLAASNNTDVQQSAIEALGTLNPGDAEQAKTVRDALVRLAASSSRRVQQSVAAALGTINPGDAKQRKTVRDALVRLAASNNPGIDQSVAIALLRNGPLDTDQLAYLLAQMYEHLEETPKWRTIGWAFLGALPGPEPGPTLMAFAPGRSGAIPIEHLPTNRLRAVEILRVFATSWAAMADSATLQNVIAARTIAIVRSVCPAAAASTSANTFVAIAEGAAREWARTLNWLRGWLGGEDSLRCWQATDRDILSQLRDNFNKTEHLGAYGRDLNSSLAADGAAPVVGQGILVAGGWTVLWTGFLIAFPYSARIRGIYLFNEKARGLVSLWFLPVIMTLLPFLRRRMLIPFREDLLADAHLAILREADWYPGVRVRDREGQIRSIDGAIPDIHGKLLLIGESGLGKSTFLRILARRSRRTIVYLNARSCDKGVEDAVVQRVGGFQSAEFFRGLIYSGDLSVIIDGLNEVSADVRAGIVAFANRPGSVNLVIATQPIDGLGTDRSPLTRTTVYELLPLAREDIAAFLKSRPARDNCRSAVRGQEYDRIVDRLLAETLDRVPADETERQTESILQEGHAAELILSNPMDLTYASELLALGQMPRPSQVIEQAFRLACAAYHDTYDRDFPTLAFARKAVELRREDRNWLNSDEFAPEHGVLERFRLVVSRPMRETADKLVTVLRFRHDKVMDVLTKPAFEVDAGLQIELLEDPRFRGVYLLFAQAEDREMARRLRDLLVSHGARTGDNGLSNEFVRRFDLGPDVN
jgi:hypothetical protein